MNRPDLTAIWQILSAAAEESDYLCGAAITFTWMADDLIHTESLPFTDEELTMNIYYWPDGSWCHAENLDGMAMHPHPDDFSHLTVSYSCPDEDIDEIVRELLSLPPLPPCPYEGA